MANDDIRWNLSLRGEKQVQKGLNDTGDAAEKAADSFDDLGDQAEAAGKKSDKAGDKFKDTAKDTGHLRREIETTTARVKDLVAQFDKTGDKSLFKDIRGAKRDLSRVAGLAKLVAEPVGESFIHSLAEAFKTGSAALKGAAVPVLAGIAVSAAPFIGAAVTSAIVTGVGAGGIGAGIALAVQDPVIKEAAAGLGETLKEAFSSSADGFAAPLLGAFEIIGESGRQFAAKLRLNELAPLVTVLAKGFAGLADNVLPGLNKALVASKPLLRVLSDELPGLGNSIGHFFSVLSDQSGSASVGLAALIRSLGSLIESAGEGLAKLSAIFEWTVKAGAEITGVFEDIAGWVPLLGDHIAGTNDDLEGLLDAAKRGKDASHDFAGGVEVIGESAEETAGKVQQLKDGIEALFGKTMDLDQATLAFKRGFKQLNEELTEGTRTLNLNTEAGQENQAAILARISEIENLRQAQANSNIGIDKANQLYGTHLEQLRKNLIQLGYNKAEVNAIIERYKAIPRTVTTNVGIVFKAQGDVSAWAALRKQERENEAAGFPARASGGPVRKGQTYWVGEKGPELVTMTTDGYVHNAADSKAMAMSGASGGSSARAGGGYAAYLQPAPNMPADMTALARLLIPYFQVVIAGLGGSVEDAMGTPTR